MHLPEKTRFASVEEFYSTLFHELSHSTGHSSRLDRKLDTDPKPFGSSDYGKEELVAEMSAAFLCSHAKTQPAVRMIEMTETELLAAVGKYAGDFGPKAASQLERYVRWRRDSEYFR